MTTINYPEEFIRLLKNVTAKRPKTVIDHILKHGFVTTEELRDTYGYDHPPRAARDVREQGIPLQTYRVRSSATGRMIGAYKFGDPSQVRTARLSGRTALTSKLKDSLITRHGAICSLYLQPFEERLLQIDHRIPFEIIGDSSQLSENQDDYMLLCPSANRAKSWSCEHCPNWTARDSDVCKTCYWAFPESYSHIATQDIRRMDLIWSGEEIVEYDQITAAAEKVNQNPPQFVKDLLRRAITHKRK